MVYRRGRGILVDHYWKQEQVRRIYSYERREL